MKSYAARVKNGRIVLVEPRLPEGAVLRVTVAARTAARRAAKPRFNDKVETRDDMDPEERAALEASLRQSEREARAGLVMPIEETLARLERRRSAKSRKA